MSSSVISTTVRTSTVNDDKCDATENTKNDDATAVNSWYSVLDVHIYNKQLSGIVHRRNGNVVRLILFKSENISLHIYKYAFAFCLQVILPRFFIFSKSIFKRRSQIFSVRICSGLTYKYQFLARGIFYQWHAHNW